MEIRIQAKAEMILTAEAQFYGVEPAAVARALIDRVVKSGMTRDVLQGVDVESYARRGRRRTEVVVKERKRFPVFVEYQGRKCRFGELSKLCGVPASILYVRVIRHGWTVERAVSTAFKSRDR